MDSSHASSPGAFSSALFTVESQRVVALAAPVGRLVATPVGGFTLVAAVSVLVVVPIDVPVDALLAVFVDAPFAAVGLGLLLLAVISMQLAIFLNATNEKSFQTLAQAQTKDKL